MKEGTNSLIAKDSKQAYKKQRIEVWKNRIIGSVRVVINFLISSALLLIEILKI